MESERAVRNNKPSGVGVMTTMQNTNSINAGLSNKIVLGVSAAVAASYVPFAITFSLSRAAHLTSASCAGFESLVAGFGLTAVILSAIAVYDARNSAKGSLLIAGVIFAMLGVAVSLTV